MKTARTAIAIALLGCASLAQAEYSATTTLVTDYVFRGISNTDGDPAIQGSLDYSHDNGFYAGAWASNVKFRENAGVDAADTVDEASIEIDYYAGFASEFANGVAWDTGALLYTYPGAESDLEYDYWEAFGSLSYAYEAVSLAPEVGVEVYYSPEYFGEIGKTWYASGTLALALPNEFGLGLTVGKQWFKDDSDLDYSDWKVAIGRSLAGFDVELAYTDTDLDKSDCDDTDICEGRVIFSVSRTLD